MKPTHIEHIGIAVSNLDESMAFYEKVLGLKCYNIEEVADQKVRTAFFMVGQTLIPREQLHASLRKGERGFIILPSRWKILRRNSNMPQMKG